MSVKTIIAKNSGGQNFEIPHKDSVKEWLEEYVDKIKTSGTYIYTISESGVGETQIASTLGSVNAGKILRRNASGEIEGVSSEEAYVLPLNASDMYVYRDLLISVNSSLTSENEYLTIKFKKTGNNYKRYEILFDYIESSESVIVSITTSSGLSFSNENFFAYTVSGSKTLEILSDGSTTVTFNLSGKKYITPIKLNLK